MPSGSGGPSPTSWGRPGAEPDSEVLDDERTPFRLPGWAGKAAVGVLVLALAAGVGPRLLAGGGGSADPKAGASTAPASPAPVPSITPTLPGSLRWATRGDLADDRALLDSVRARLVGTELTSVEEVLWAGRVTGGRAVVVAGFDQRDGIDPAYSVPVVGVLLPTGGGAPQTTRIGDLSGGPATVLAWSLPHGQALLLGPPAPLDAQVSADITFTSDGRARRTWLPARAEEGWTLVSLPARAHPVLAVRTDLGAWPVLSTPDVNLSDVSVAGLDAPGYRGPDAAVVRDFVTQQMPQPPLAGWAVTARVGWSARVGEGGIGHAVVVIIRRSDGATFLAGMIGGLNEGPADYGLRTVRWDHPERAPYLFGDLGGSIGLDGRQVVAVPGGRGTLTYTTARGHATVPISAAGVALVPSGVFDADPVGVTVHNRFGSQAYDRRALIGDDPLGAGFENRIGADG